MKLALAALAVLLTPRAADAGRYCGSDETFAPGEGSTLPIGPTIAMHVEHAYFQGNIEHRAVPTKLKITLAGKPVKFTTKDVRVADGLIRYITIKSKATGELVITSAKAIEGEVIMFATYTISESWQAPETAAVTVSRGRDTRLDVYRVTGDFALVRVEAPAISFSVKWRKNAKAAWRTVLVPASIANVDWRARIRRGDDKTPPPPTAGFAEARIGEGVCGMAEHVPMSAVDAGIEIQLTAKLPDGKTMTISELASPLALPAKPTRRDGYDGLSPLE